MFVGHYAAGLALKKVEKNAPLGLLFLAVQFVDILFFPFAVLGIERFKIVDASPKLGFGLWNNAVATYLLEAILLLIGLRLYLTENQGTTFWGKYGMVLFVGLMLIVNAVNIFGPPLGATVTAMAASALFFYVAFAGVAYWLDKQRSE